MPTCVQIVFTSVVMLLLCGGLVFTAQEAAKNPAPSAGPGANATLAGDFRTWLVTNTFALFQQCPQTVAPQSPCSPCKHTPCDSVADEVAAKLSGEFKKLLTACVSGYQDLKTAVENLNATAAASNQKHDEATTKANESKLASDAAATKFKLAMPALCITVAAHVQFMFKSTQQTIFILFVMVVSNALTLWPESYAQTGLACFAVACAVLRTAWHEYTKPTIEEQMEARDKSMQAWILGSVKALFVDSAKSGQTKQIDRPAVVIGGHRLAPQSANEGERMNSTVTETEPESDVDANAVEGSSAVAQLWRNAPGGPASEPVMHG